MGKSESLLRRPDVVAVWDVPADTVGGFWLMARPGEIAGPVTLVAVTASGRREPFAHVELAGRGVRRTPGGELRAALRPDAVGVEIGAHVNPVQAVPAYYADYTPAFAGSEGRVDFLSDGMALPLEEGALDFLCSSHVLEHLPNPLGALYEWRRVLAEGGLLYLVVPDMRYTFDVGRPVTPVRHLLDDYVGQATARTAAERHIEEFVFHTDWRRLRPDCPPGEEALQREATSRAYREAIARGEHIDIHFHTFTPDSLRELLRAAGLLGGNSGFELVAEAEQYPPQRGDGIGLLLRRTGPVRRRFRRATYELRRPDLARPLRLVSPSRLEPLALDSSGEGLSGGGRETYPFADNIPDLRPRPGGRVHRSWDTTIVRRLRAWTSRLRGANATMPSLF